MRLNYELKNTTETLASGEIGFQDPETIGKIQVAARDIRTYDTRDEEAPNQLVLTFSEDDEIDYFMKNTLTLPRGVAYAENGDSVGIRLRTICQQEKGGTQHGKH